MARPISAVFAVFLAIACGSSSTQLTCPTKAQSLSFTAIGSCGGGNTKGTVTISTQPGLCTLLAKGGASVGIPTTGQFTGDATKTGYDLTKGNWSLSIQQGNAVDGSTNIQCDWSRATGSTVVDLKCSGSLCPPDEGSGAQCSIIDCAEHLTPM